jgi:hypothetical protein
VQKLEPETGLIGDLSLLDRTDRGESRRRGTDLVRVQQTRTVSKGGRKQPSIYLSESGPRRVTCSSSGSSPRLSSRLPGSRSSASSYILRCGDDGSGSVLMTLGATLIHDLAPPANNLSRKRRRTVDRCRLRGTTTRSNIYDRPSRGAPTSLHQHDLPLTALATERLNEIRLGVQSVDLFWQRPRCVMTGGAGYRSARFSASSRCPAFCWQDTKSFPTEAEKLVAEADAVYAESKRA